MQKLVHSLARLTLARMMFVLLWSLSDGVMPHQAMADSLW
jgi:hypothetical protein